MPDDSGQLQIIGAAYGLAVVTPQVAAAINRASNPQTLSIVANNATFGDSWPGTLKTLTVVYRYGSAGAVAVKTVTENNTLTIAQGDSSASEDAPRKGGAADAPALTVWGASYGPADVSQKVRRLINSNQQLSFTANNQTFGDSLYGTAKSFVIVASYPDQVPFTDVISEGSPYFLKYRPRLQIMSGFYGLKDVTSQLQANVSRRALSIAASNAVFGDGWPGVNKTLSVVYQYGTQSPQLKVAVEATVLSIDYDPSLPPYTPPADPSALNVLAASYGRGDVTQKVRSLIQKQQLAFAADNATFGDTWPGVNKSFTILYGWGTATTVAIVAAETSPVRIENDPRVMTTAFLPLAGLIASGDHLQIQTGTGLSWGVDGTGQVLATATPAAGTSKFTVSGVTVGSGSFSLQASDGTYVVLAGQNLRTGGTQGQAAVFIPSAVSSGSVALAVAGATGAPFLGVSPLGGAITAGAGFAPEFASTFVVMLEPTEVGLENHLMLHTGRSLAQLQAEGLDDQRTLALLKVIWDLTGGWFLALGLGPLLRGADEAAPGVLALLRQNARIAAIINSILATATANWGKIGVAALLALPAAIWDEGLMGTVVRMLFNMGFWIGVGWVIYKIALWVSLPAAKAAEMMFAFANWAYTTITDVMAYVNAGGGSVKPSGLADGINLADGTGDKASLAPA